ncbi:MAG: TolC family protein [Bacteroidetes bacterium]|nr:TolC family protein [Bacteroidota bacterium]
MNKKLSILILFIIAIICSISKAQTILTVDEAIKNSLEKNYNVLIQKNINEISKLQNNFGNAGMSPTVSLNANLALSNLNSYQEFSTGTIQQKNGAQSHNIGASLNAGWVVFDGLKMFTIKKRLTENERLSEITLKQQMENTIFDIISLYYNVVKLNQLIKASKQNIEIYDERRKIAQLKFDIGSDSKVDLMLAQTNLNKAKSSLIQLEIQLLNAKTNLNSLMFKPIDTDFNTSDSIIINYNPDINELKTEVVKNNSSLLISKQMENISYLNYRESQSANMPIVQLNGSYNFIQNQSQAGFVFLNKQSGINVGVTAGWLIFNGTKNSKLSKERNINYLNQKYSTDLIQQKVDAQVFNSYKNFILNKSITLIENQNLIDAKELISISIERYKIGKTNLLETIEVQKNLEDAQVRYIEALYAMKIAETELLRTNGKLIK